MRCARRRPATRHVHDPIEKAEDRVDVVGDDQHGHALVPADALDEPGDAGLVRKVETVERLVEQEQRRPARQCLRDEQPLLLTARALADGPARVLRRSDELDQLVDPVLQLTPRSCATAAARPTGRRRDPTAPRRRRRMRSEGSKLRRWGR